MKSLYSYLVLAFSLLITGCTSTKEISNKEAKGLYYDPAGSTITTNKKISLQKKQTYYFPESGIYASNEFLGARLNDFYKASDSIYFAEIKPENEPINNSAWYSFKLWADRNQLIQVILFYENGSHRYYPKISNDGKNWERLDSSSYLNDTLTRSAILSLDIGKDTLWVSAQELVISDDYDKWFNDLSKKNYVKKNIIGYSSEGRPLHELEISEAGDNADFIFITGRQHPPEVTGAFALRAFIETIVSETDIAKQFRKQFRTFIVPLVNPDGVDAGHWRHNINGVDLNRDWINFNQPEPEAVRDELLRLQRGKGKLRFFIDFHSTQEDVFYITSADSTLEIDTVYQLTKEWLNKIAASNLDYKMNIDESLNSGNSPTSDNWVYNEFHVPALTYEIGDETNRDLIRRIASSAANALMHIFIK